MTDNATMIGLAADNAQRARKRIADTRQAIVDRILPSEELVAAYLEFEAAQKILDKLERERRRQMRRSKPNYEPRCCK